MPVVGDAAIVVDADTAPFDKNLKGNVTKSVGGVSTIIKGVLGAAVVTQGARAGLDFLKGSIGEAREANAVAAQTAAVLKSTGDAAKISAKGVDDLANSISRKTGIDDEQIAKAENLLLTFTGIRNETGKNNDIFNQATKIAVDMGKALGTDAAGSAIQLGKALNDPLKGITALTRVGVTFSDQQKEQIKNFQAAGKTAEAQKVILAELNKEFGGSAEAQATAGDRLKVTIGNIQEQIGNKLVPVIDKAATFLADRLPGALDAAGKAFGKLQKIVGPIIDGIKQTIGVLFAGDFIGGGPFAEDSPFIVSLFNLRDQLLPIVQNFAAFIQDNLKPILIGLGAAALLIAGPFVAIGAAFVLAYTKSQTFRDIVAAVIEGVTTLIDGLVKFVQENLPKFQEAFEHVANAVVAVWNQLSGTIVPVVEAVVNTIIAIVGRIVEVIKQVVLFVTNIINGDFAAAFGNLKNIVANVIGAVLDVIKGLVPAIAGLVVGVVSAMASLAGDIIKGLVRGIKDKAGDVIDAIKKFVLDKVPKFVKKFFGIDSPSKMFAGFGQNLMEGMAQGIRGGAGSPLDALAAVNSRLANGSTARGGTSAPGSSSAAASAGSAAGVSFRDIVVQQVENNPEATAFAVMSRIAAGLNL